MKSIALVDFSHMLVVAFKGRANDSGPNDAGQATLDQLSQVRRDHEHCIVCLDSSPYARTKAYPEYKQGRVQEPELAAIFKWTRERLVSDGYSIAAVPGAEADDVLASLADQLSDRCFDIRIIGADKDALQCVTEKVRVYCPKGRGEYEVRDTAWVEKRYGIKPAQVPMLLAIMGDKSDNIPGIPGIGEKGAAKLITQYGTIEKMRLAAVTAFEESQKEGAKPLAAFWVKFLDGAPRLGEWLALTTLKADLNLDLPTLLTKQAIKPLVKDDVEDWDEIAEREAIQAESNVTETPKVEAKTEAPKPQATAPVVSVTTAGGPAVIGAKSREPEEIQAIVVDRPAPPNWALALQPRTSKEAEIISAKLYNSRHYMALEHAPGVLAIILKGRELGLGMMAALEMFFLVKGRPFPSAKGLRFLAERDPNCEWIMVTSADKTHATVKTKHRQAGVLEYTYTAERARDAGYFAGGNRHNWNTLTQEMLEARATSKAVNRWYSGATFGMPSSEEMSDREEVESE